MACRAESDSVRDMHRTTTRSHALSGLLSLALLVAPATAWSADPDEEAAATQTPAPASEEAPPEVIGEVVVEVTPEPVKRRNDHTFGEKTYDVLVLRPFDFLGLIASSVAFVPAAVLTAPNGRYEVETAYDVFVVEPAENVFERELGKF